MHKYSLIILLLICSQCTRGNSIEIRYHAPQASQVTIIWGVNYWNTLEHPPAGTFIKRKAMHTPMKKDGDDYILTLDLPDSTVVNYLFLVTRKEGPFNIGISYYDANVQSNSKNYHTKVAGNPTVRLSATPEKLTRSFNITLLAYTGFFLVVFLLLAVSIFVGKRIIKPSGPSSPINHAAIFLAIPMALFGILFLIRVVITRLAVDFIIDPIQTFPILIHTSYQDLLYVFMLTFIFGIFFFFKKKKKEAVLYFFGVFGLLSILIGMANIKLTELLGRPFNYQWMYYSDFLNSKDAKSAITVNLGFKTLAAYLFMILAALPLTWLFYQLLIRWRVVTVAVFLSAIALGSFAINKVKVDDLKTENPVIYFVTSLTQLNDLPSFSNDDNTIPDEFRIKNVDEVLPGYSSKFKEGNIKNVVVFVMESTPAEYLTPYDSGYATTPFLNSLKSSSVIFDEIYAHSPATNKSMVSMLCGVYPYLSFKTITREKPDISWPSISSELNKAGYNTSFFNSGDNRFHGAGDFLKHRGFDEIQDYRNNPCNSSVFLDKAGTSKNYDGINDTCLAMRFFNWMKPADTTPFFTMMWTYQSHYPYYSTGKLTDFKTNNESLERYLNSLKEADNSLRNLVEGLKKRDLFNSTLIVVVGDHGEAFGRHGQTSHGGGLYEENIHIPLILINPMLFGGERIKSVGGACDLAPTIFSILNKPIHSVWQGQNLFSTHRNPRVYFYNPYAGYLFGCREGDYKYIYNASSNTSFLYDLSNDPHEANNLADQQTERVKEMKKHLNGWMKYQTDFVNVYVK